MIYPWWRSLNRFWLHVPVGLVLVFLAWFSWVLAAIYAGLFLAYEINEDHWVKDEAWRDIAGSLAGIIIGSLILAIVLRRPL